MQWSKMIVKEFFNKSCTKCYEQLKITLGLTHLHKFLSCRYFEAEFFLFYSQTIEET